MTPAMYERVRNHFVDAGITTGFIVQLLAWEDTTKLTDAFIVFRPNGGTDIRNDLGSDHYVMVDVISATSITRLTMRMCLSAREWRPSVTLPACPFTTITVCCHSPAIAGKHQRPRYLTGPTPSQMVTRFRTI